MHMRLIAVGDRQPGWVETAFADYARRLPRHWKFNLHTIATGRRRKQTAVAARDEEGDRIAAEVRASERAVILDEQGLQLSSIELAETIGGWHCDGRDVCFVIGGPDGISDACMARADFRWSLSRLTLPHGIARIVCAEQLYRASSLQDGHPYHRA
jgi:23S rRNA (pseudouridine1915-N3)-methyltransferase